MRGSEPSTELKPRLGKLSFIEDLQAEAILRNTELRNSIATVNENSAKLALESMQTTDAFELQTSASGKASKKKLPKKRRRL